MFYRRKICTPAITAGLGLITVLAPIAQADLLQPGTRSGTISVYGDGTNSGNNSPAPVSDTLTLPTSGPGNITDQVWANGFYDGLGPPQVINGEGSNAVASPTLVLGTVAGNSYSLAAYAAFGFSGLHNSGESIVGVSYTFDQKIVVSQPVAYTLSLTVTRPNLSGYQGADGGQVALPVPGETFTGPGVSDALSLPYSFPPNFITPTTQSQTFTGTLDPGTYSFDSSWATPHIAYGASNNSDSETTSVMATLTVSAAVPEPASAALLITAAAAFTLRRKKHL